MEPKHCCWIHEAEVFLPQYTLYEWMLNIPSINMQTYSLTLDHYLFYLGNELRALLEEVPSNIRIQMYQLLHISLVRSDNIRINSFPDYRLVAVVLLAGLHDFLTFTPLDYCLWGWFKNGVYRVKVDTRDALIRRMRTAALLIEEKHESIRNETKAFCKRNQMCFEIDIKVFDHSSK